MSVGANDIRSFAYSILAGGIIPLINHGRGLGLLSILTIPGWQVFNWLQTGAWYPIPLLVLLQRSGISPYMTDWVGIQKIISGTLEMPLALALLFLAEGVAVVFLALGEAVYNKVAK